MARQLPRSITKSFLRSYFFCPRYAYFEYCSDEPRWKTYAMLCGEAVHDCIRTMHHQAPASRTLFYRSTRGLLKAWFGELWPDTLKEARTSILHPDDAEAQRYAGIGAKCLKLYWEQHRDAPRPREVEARYRVADHFPLPVVGVLDQVIEVSLDWIAAHRPELVREGRLDARYDPVVIRDFKSGYRSYDATEMLPLPMVAPAAGGEAEAFDTLCRLGLDWTRENRESLLANKKQQLAPGYAYWLTVDPHSGTWVIGVRRAPRERSRELTPDDWLTYQTPLFLDTQAELYPWLYASRPDHEGRLPVAFDWHHLLTSKSFFTYPRAAEHPGDNPFAELEAKLGFVARAILAAEGPEGWPRHEGLHCRTCEYRQPCLGDREQVIAYPEDFRDRPAAPPTPIVPPARKKPQRRLKFRPGWTLRDPAADANAPSPFRDLPDPPPPSFGPLFAAGGVYDEPPAADAAETPPDDAETERETA